MSQVLQLVEQVRHALAQTVQAPADQVAWVVGLQVASVTKAHKYARGNSYREITQSMSRVYRAQVEKNNVTDPLQKWTMWYNLNIKALKAMKAAAGQLAAGATP